MISVFGEFTRRGEGVGPGMTTMAAKPVWHSGPRTDTGGTPTGSWISPAAFVLLAAELFAACGLAGVYGIVRATHPEIVRSGLQFPQWGWGVAQLIAVALGAACLAAAAGHLRDRRQAAAMVFSALAAIYGLAGLGLKGLEWVRWGGPQFIELAGPAPVADQTPAAPAGQPVGDANLGARVFGASCAACHGSKAEGIAQVAPGLRDSPFVKSAADPQLAALIRDGRPAADPANRTGKAMPPRGGNPFLSDPDIANLVAFLRTAKQAAPAGDTPAPGASLPRWVVPDAPAGPQGLADAIRTPAPATRVPEPWRSQAPGPAERALVPIAAAMTALHALHLAVATAMALGLLGIAYAGRPGPAEWSFARLGRFYWLAAVVLWAAWLPLLYWV